MADEKKLPGEKNPREWVEVITDGISSGGLLTIAFCPKCGSRILYNGNYFCEKWVWPFATNEGECDWALPHPVTKKADRAVCDLLGTDYL